MEILAKTFIVPAKPNQSIQENTFNNAPVRRIAIAMNTNSAFTGSYTENPIRYRQFDLRKITVLRGGQPFFDFDAADYCFLYVLTKKAMNFPDKIPSFPIDNFKEHYVLVSDLISMQDATDNCNYPELFEKRLRLELNFTFPLEHVTEIILLEKRISSVAVDKFGVVGKIYKMDNASLQQIINRIVLFRFRYHGSFPSDCFPTLGNDTFAIINTQPSNMLGEQRIMIANSRHKLYLAHSLGRSSFLKQQCKEMMPEPLQSLPSVCSVYAIYADFHVFNIQHEEIPGVFDVNVLSLLINYM